MSRPNLPAPDKPREPGAHRSPASHTCGRWGFVASTRRWIDGLAASLPNRHRRSRSESAFTLIELIVTVVILAIIVAIAIPSFLSQRRNGFDSQTVSDIRTLAQVETGLVAANAAPTRWQTGDDPALMDGFDGTDGVQHLVLSNTDDPTNPQWCVLGWNERGSKDSQDNPVWVASDSPTVSQQPIAEDCACAILLGLEGSGPDNPGGEIGGGGVAAEPHMTMVFDTSLGDREIVFWLGYPGENARIDWGDDVVVDAVDGKNSHTYSDDGIYHATIFGTFDSFISSYSNTPGLDELVEVTSWEATETKYLSNAFHKASNLTTVAAIPSGVVNMLRAFEGASSFNNGCAAGDTSCPLNWDMSTVEDMSYMFYGATAFNQPIGHWDTSSAKIMYGMFRDAGSFNQPIGNWNVENVTIMSEMFYGATSFNQSLNGWKTGNVQQMSAMFQNATSFNGAIGAWDTRNVTMMPVMFNGASAFNQPIGNWDTGSVMDMSALFMNASSFDQDISCWDVSKINYMSVFNSYAAGQFHPALSPEHIPPQGSTGCPRESDHSQVAR